MKKCILFLLWMGIVLGIPQISAAQSTYQVKASGGANLRQGPSKDQPVAMSVPEGAKVKVIERTNDKWVKVEYNGKTGYMSSELIEPENQNNQNRSNTAQSQNQPAKSQSSNSSSSRPSNSSNNSNSNRSTSSQSSPRKSSASNAYGSNYKWGIGIRLGDPTALTVKKYMGNQNAWEFNLGRSYRWGYNYGDNDFYRRNKYNDRSQYYYLGYNGGFTTTLQAHYLMHRPLGNAEGLSFYFGGGPQVRFTPITYRYYYNQYNLKGDDWWKTRYYVEERVTDIDLGLDGVIGLEYQFKNAPISLFLDANIFIEIIDAPFFFYGQSGLGVRYNF